MSVNETVLEMHFHKALMDLIREAFGIGPQGRMNFYKWSPQKECYVGFDQAYVSTQLGDDEFFDLLKSSAASRQYQLGEIIFGYFLQFKVVQRFKKRNSFTPPQVAQLPYYRVSLDTKQNGKTGVSQHELLYKLSKNKRAFVYYACPMLFEKTDLYQNADLEKLQLVDLDSCQDIYNDYARHHIYFDENGSDPIWKSEPHTGRAISPKEFARRLVGKYSDADSLDMQETLIDLLSDWHSLGVIQEKGTSESIARRKFAELISESLIVVRINRQG